jgi:hypothetical protein
MGSSLGQVTRLLLFDARGASPLSQNFFNKFHFDKTFHQPGPLREFLRSNLDKPFRVLYQPVVAPPSAMDDDEPKHTPALMRHFNAVTHLVIACGRMIFFVDEIDRVSTSSWAPKGLDYLINQGRHVQVSLGASSRRPAQIPKDLTSQAHEMVIFKNTEPGDCDYLEKYVGKSAAERLPNLGDYEFVRWEESEGISIGGGFEKALG